MFDDYLINHSSATAHIGLPVTRAVLRAGYIVYGQTQSKSNKNQFAAEQSRRLDPIPVRRPHDKPTNPPIGCQPVNADKRKHLLATVEAIFGITSIYAPE